MARALVVPRHGGSEVLQVQEVPEPTPQDGEVLVDVAAVGVNFIDVYQREGVYPNQTPFVLGMEGAGTVRDTGERVAWGQRLGTGATVAAIPAD